ncbi:hypothetical protein [Neoactinobaculum massilliense]|uniref:hypothetical protein n=1 Tax=Neoactinobaculum massilliense TaxID=2364794 RepID=UPI000F5315C1|nr:hypothetical protein [Neoactinobaculum massilliense]
MIFAILLLIIIVVGAILLLYFVARPSRNSARAAIEEARDKGLSTHDFSVVVEEERVGSVFASFPADSEAYLTPEGVEENWDRIRSESQAFTDSMRAVSERFREEAVRRRRSLAAASGTTTAPDGPVAEPAVDVAAPVVSEKPAVTAQDEPEFLPSEAVPAGNSAEESAEPEQARVARRIHLEELANAPWRPNATVKFPPLGDNRAN